MRIAVFHNLPRGGALRVLNEELKYLGRKHIVKVFTADISLTENRFIRDVNNFLGLYILHMKLAKKIDQEKVDMVLVHPDKLTQAPFLLRFLKTPSIYFCEELLRIGYERKLAFNLDVGLFKKLYEKLTRYIRKLTDKANARNASQIIVASKYIQEKVKSAYLREALVCPLGVDTKVFKKYPGKKINQLVFVGEANKINGYFFAKEVADKLKLPLKVISGWKLTDNQLAKEYSHSLATLCSSFNEPFGLVPLEVQACEGVVIAVNSAGYKETIVAGKTGYLLDRKVNDFVSQIKTVKRQKLLASQIGKSARQHMLENYTWEKHGKLLEKILAKVK